ncbi:MAG: hypothetical protein JW699_06335 [Chitinispirillaceae bacterium]|nr:hypothetical protein [Chitinispirillaceae bacterium]
MQQKGMSPLFDVSEENLRKREVALLHALTEYGLILNFIKISGKYINFGFASFDDFMRNSKLSEDVAKFAYAFFESKMDIKALNGLIQIQKKDKT